MVTGAASGIGAAVTRELVRDGYTVGLMDRDELQLRRVAEEHQSSWWRVVDLRDTDAAMRAVHDFGASAGGLDLLVNNAATVFPGGLFEHTPEIFDEMMAVNARAPLFCLQAAAAIMRDQGRGCVVNVASTSGVVSSPNPSIAYDMSKAAVCLLTASAARELGKFGIRVCAVAPSTTRTPMVKAITNDPARIERSEAAIPLGRLADPEDIARVIAFLGSPAAAYVTGHTWVVDGGRIA